MKVESGAQDIIAEQPAIPHLLQGYYEPLNCQWIFCSDINVTFRCPYGISADEHTFQNSVGVAFHYCPIHESTGVSFIGIAHYIFDGARCIVAELPFGAGGEARATSTAQSRFLHLIDYFLRLHLERLDKALVTTVGNILMNVCRVYIPTVAQGDTNLWLQYREFEQLGDSLQGTFATSAHSKVGARIISNQPVPDNLSHEFRGKVAIEDAGLARFYYLYQRLGVAEPDAAYLHNISLNVVFLQFFAQSLEYIFCTCCHTAGSCADQNTGSRAALHCFPVRSRFSFYLFETHCAPYLYNDARLKVLAFLFY